ncbi:hypothetical protein ACLOJK_026589 [Asimina triloba]
MNHTTQTVCLDGKVAITATITDMPDVVDDWVGEIRQMGGPPILGFVCEWRPHIFRPPNKIATLQLSTNNRCLIAQLFYMSKIPKSLKDLLDDPSFIFVGVGVVRDARKLRKQYKLRVANAVEIDPSALAKRGRLLSRPAYVNLARAFCVFRLIKYIKLSLRNWVATARVPSEEQIEYGCIDACACYAIGCELLLD